VADQVLKFGGGLRIFLGAAVDNISCRRGLSSQQRTHRPPLVLSIDGIDRRTDGRTDGRLTAT